MTPQETLKSIEKQRNEFGFNGNLYVTVDEYYTIKQALEKQIPKKIVKIDRKVVSIFKNERKEEKYAEYRCPKCENWIANIPRRIMYCEICGQALDWSNDNV